jgi:hypothetical protein
VEASQPLFKFEWKDPDTGAKGQLTWNRLPQGFKNSPTIFGEALARDLENCRPKGCTVLQYVDDTLSSPYLGGLQKWNRRTTPIPIGSRIQISQKKSQICLEEVIYLGYHLSQGKRRLGTGRKEVIFWCPCPESQRQLWEFLGTVGFCRLWIRGFLVTAGPLYVALKGNPIGPLLRPRSRGCIPKT